jgi:hypothetical protein
MVRAPFCRRRAAVCCVWCGDEDQAAGISWWVGGGGVHQGRELKVNKHARIVSLLSVAVSCGIGCPGVMHGFAPSYANHFSRWRGDTHRRKTERLRPSQGLVSARVLAQSSHKHHQLFSDGGGRRSGLRRRRTWATTMATITMMPYAYSTQCPQAGQWYAGDGEGVEKAHHRLLLLCGCHWPQKERPFQYRNW